MVRSASRPDAQAPGRRSAAQNPEATFGGQRFDSHNRFGGILRTLRACDSGSLPRRTSTDEFIEPRRFPLSPPMWSLGGLVPLVSGQRCEEALGRDPWDR